MNKNEPLTEKELLEKAPAIFTLKPSPTGVSPKYSFIPTIQILNDFKINGWEPYDATQMKSTYKDKSPYTKHMVRLRNKDVGDIDGVIPEIIITNSHDGRNSFKLHAGLFRLVCANGLVIADQTFEEAKIKHQWYKIEDVMKVIEAMITNVPVMIANVQKFKNTQMTDSLKKEFVKKAIKTRWEKGNDYLLAEDVLRPMRGDDEGDDLWSVYNIVQEKLIRGGLVYNLPNGRQQTARELTNIDKRLDVNKKLWALTEEYS